MDNLSRETGRCLRRGSEAVTSGFFWKRELRNSIIVVDVLKKCCLIIGRTPYFKQHSQNCPQTFAPLAEKSFIACTFWA